MAGAAESPTPDPARILVRGVNWLGDAVMTTPALQRLRERYPETEITLLTADKLAGLWTRDTATDRVVTFSPGESIWTLSRRLRQQRYSCGLILPNSHRSALEFWLAGIPNRIGIAASWRNWLLTRAVPRGPQSARMRKRSPAEVRALTASPPAPRPELPDAAHQVFEYLRLVGAMGADETPLPPRLVVPTEEAADVAARLIPGYCADTGDILLGVNPGAEYGPAKRWPADRFAAVIRDVSSRMPRCQWAIFGGSADRGVCAEIAAQAGRPVFNLSGQTNLRELLCLLKLCRALVTNDTGPMHVAAALGTPVVALFGSTSPALTGPGLPGETRHRLLKVSVPCSPCFLRSCPIDFRCMTNIGVEQVVAAVLDVCKANDRA